MPCPTIYKGLSFADKKNRKRQEGATPHSITYLPETDHCFVVTSRRMPYNAHLKPPEEVAEDPHAACAYRLSDAVARKRAGELRWHLRAVAPHTMALVSEFKFKPLEHVLCAKMVRCAGDCRAAACKASSDAGDRVTCRRHACIAPVCCVHP